MYAAAQESFSFLGIAWPCKGRGQLGDGLILRNLFRNTSSIYWVTNVTQGVVCAIFEVFLHLTWIVWLIRGVSATYPPSCHKRTLTERTTLQTSDDTLNTSTDNSMTCFYNCELLLNEENIGAPGWLSWWSLCFQVRSWSRGPGIGSDIGLPIHWGVCLSLLLCSSFHPCSFSFEQINKICF